ncbi:uncharacterized protein LOC132933433 [Metopolophium dirhodum]|uniref:uncharacterized protein LOC132933433 n=1 Tax=Metopolophium dirhodum TaxID=44670 RepID=UPI00298F8295|nr:uncharacterized protein LOC132933433 [Metopolophium dirhodum]
MLMVCIFVSTLNIYYYYISNVLSGIVQIAPHVFVPDLQPGPSSVRKDCVSTARDKQNVRLSPIQDNARDELTSNANECWEVLDDIDLFGQNDRLSPERDNTMDEFWSNVNDAECLEVLDTVENLGLYDSQDSYTTLVNGKRVSSANTTSAVRLKKLRLNLVKSSGFTQISTSSNHTITCLRRHIIYRMWNIHRKTVLLKHRLRRFSVIPEYRKLSKRHSLN